ncbi:MAG: glycosyltransferase family 4 protein [Rhodospirillales bacterium]
MLGFGQASGSNPRMSSVRNVVVLSDYAFFKGGAEKIALTSAVGLAEAGLNVSLFSAVGPVADGMDRLNSIHCLRQLDIASDPERVRAMTRGLWNATAKASLAEVLSNFSPDDTVIHAHQWNKALTTSVFDAVRKGDFEFVLTLHDYFIACPNGGFLIYPRNEICEHKPLTFGCVVCNCDVRHFSHKVWRTARHMIQNKLYGLPSHTKHCIYLSEFSRNVLKPYLPAQTQWHHVPNPSDFGNSSLIDVAKNDTFLFVGRLSAEKGATVFAEAAKQAGVKAVFVGDGEEKEAILRANPDATVTGWLERPAVLARYRESRALVFPSLWYECQPLAVLEALSLGLPVIVTDRCAASEAVVEGVNGYCFARGSVSDLAERIRLLRNDDHVKHLSNEAYRMARSQTPDMKEHVQKLIGVYDHMLAIRG